MKCFRQRERQLKLEKVQATKQQIDEFKREQAKWKLLEQEKIEAENRRIMAFMKQQQDAEESRKTRMKEREEAKQQIQKMVTKKLFYLLILSMSNNLWKSLYLLFPSDLQLCEKMEKDKKQREDFESIRQELYLEEQEEAQRKKDIVRIKRKTSVS